MEGDGDDAHRAMPARDWGWPGDLGKDELNEIAPVSLELWRRGADWVNRRVETVELLDVNAVRMRLSVDFRIPRKLPGQHDLGGKPTYFLPITAMPRNGSLAYFDARDESGSSVPILTRDENAQLTGLMLVAAAKRAISTPDRELELSPELTRHLSVIPMASSGSMRRRLHLLFRDDSRLFSNREVAETLLEDGDFLNVLGLCTFCCFVHAPIVAAPGERRIVKLAWTSPWDSEVVAQPWYKDPFRRLWSWLGWRTHVRYLLVHHAGNARSYHVQLQAPERVDLTASGLSINRPADLIQAWFTADDPEKPVLPEHGADDLRRRTVSGVAQRKHLYVDRAHLHRSGALWVRLRSSRHGFLRPATAVAGFVAVVLMAFAERAPNVLGDAQTAAAILLVVPALIAGFLVVPGEHEMTRHLLRGPRALTGLAGFLALGAVIALVTIPDSSPESVETLATYWRIGAFLAAGLASMLVLSWLAPGASPFHWTLSRWMKKLPRRAIAGRAKEADGEGNS